MNTKFDFKFGDGIAYFGELRIFLSPVNYFLYGIYHNSQNKSGEELIKKFKKYSETDSKLIYDFLEKKYNYKHKKLMLIDFLDIINSFGFGKLNLVGNVNLNKLVINLNRCHMGNLYKKFFNESCDFLIEEILAGFVENFLSCLYGKKVSSKFSVNGASLSLECFISDEDYIFKNDRKYFSEKKKFTISNWLKSFIFSKKIGPNENGTFALGHIYAVCMPWFFGIDYLLDLIKGDMEFRDNLAKMEGGILVKFNSKKISSSPNVIMNKILMNFGAAALGKFNVINLKNGIFEMSSDFDTHFGRFYSKDDLFLLKRNVAMIVCGAYEFAYDVNVSFEFDGKILILTKVSKGRKLNSVESEISKNLTVRNFMFKI